MSHNKSEQGFTLLEMIAVFVLISIMAAISGPSMIGFLQQAKIKSAQNELQGLLKSGQRSAIRQGKACTITFPTSGASAASIPVSASCVPADSSITLKEVKIRHNLNPVGTTFPLDFKGRPGFTTGTVSGTDTGEDLVIVLSAQDNSNYQKCIVVSRGLGLIRTGNYPSGNTSTLVATSCAPGS